MKTGVNGNINIHRLLNIAKGVYNGYHWNTTSNCWHRNCYSSSSKETRRSIINFIVTTAIIPGVAAKAAPVFCGDI
jgi:hypothetical protein